MKLDLSVPPTNLYLWQIKPQSVKVMKALTSSCSKPILDKPISSSPRVAAAVHVSDRTDFCLNQRSKNDKKDCNFRVLKLVQNKGIYPVLHAVPSKTQATVITETDVISETEEVKSVIESKPGEVDLETIESELETVAPQDQQIEESEQTSESKFVRVTFQLEKNCDFGEQFLIVGDDPVLGSWDPADALPMTWSDGHIWTVDLNMPTGKSILFKFILKGKAGDIVWQPGSDRIIQTWETTKRIIVCEDWENGELQKIKEEDELDQSNEETQVDSEMSAFAEHLDNPDEGLVSNISKISGIEDSQTHAEEKPLGETDLHQTNDDSISSLTEKPMAIVAENIGFSEDLINWSEKSADNPRNDNIIQVVGHNGTAAPIKNQERTAVESNLFDFEGSPVLVPGLTSPVVANEEAGSGEVQESTTIDTSIEAFESKDQNTPEFSKEQESNDSTPPEINTTLKNEPELLHNEYEEQSHLSPAMEDRSNSETVDGNVLQNDIQWGRQTVMKFLTKLGLL